MAYYVEVNICQFCLKNTSKYTCPRCNLNYCSSKCYKSEKHQSCSEAFYEECVLEELKQNFARPYDKKQIIEMLQKLNKNEEEVEFDDESAPDLIDRIADLNIEEEADAVWNVLTTGEKEEFQAMIRDGRIGHLIPQWRPWWFTKENLVKEIDVTSELPKNYPPIINNILPLKQLIPKTQAAQEVRYNLINILFSYLYIARLYNGDHLNCPKQAVEDLLPICEVLSCSKIFNYVGEAVHSCITLLQKSSVPFDLHFAITILKDLEYILIASTKAPFYLILCSLSDLHKMLKTSRKVYGNAISNHNSQISLDLRNQLFLCEKKVEFFLSWVQECGLELKMCILELNNEITSFEKAVLAHKKTKNQFEKVWGSKRPPPKKKLIEELITN